VIIKLLPEQVVKFWDMLRFAIAETFIPRNSCTNQHLQAILANLLASKAQCWMVFDRTDDGRKFIGFMVTRIGEDPAIKERCLFIDSVYAFQKVPEDLLTQSNLTLEKFAKQNNCKSIATMTESARIVKLAEMNGYSKRVYLFKEV
jgi:hypothetical protein